ncbi:unnamed protein product [Jaminaea pallidilutea]
MASVETDVPRAPPLSSLAIPNRPPRNSILQTILFTLYFNTAIILIHTAQVIVQPFRALPAARDAVSWVNGRAKGGFCKGLVSMTWIFSPTNLVLSFRDEKGNQLDPSQFVEFRSDGRVSRLKLPHRAIWLSNHQVYTDWLYLWIVAYFCGFEEGVYIILKDSLKWAPMIGLSMQWFDFIFLARDWLRDRVTFADKLSKLARISRAKSDPLTYIIFPEGTLVSKDTRPKSKKYADSVGIPDFVNTIVPKTRGTLYSLRTLKKEVADLKVVDATIGYPGIPPAGYGQSYYTLRSIYMQGVPPPSVHISITIRSVESSSPDLGPEEAAQQTASVPIGDMKRVAQTSSPEDIEATEDEKKAFDAWTLARWREKDDLLSQFYRDGDFVGGAFVRNKEVAGEYYRESEDETTGGGPGVKTENEAEYVTVPIALRSPIEVADVFAWGFPLWFGWLLWWWLNRF